MEKYKTILKDSITEQIIDKSKFIGHARPVESKEEADAFFAEIRSKHKDATHNVPAFVIGDKFQLQWGSDDGEPQGTSGAPMVQMMVKEGITNTAVIITRYFGGIKLGTGGLVRAYTGAAKSAIEAGIVCSVKDQYQIQISTEYTYHGKIQNLSQTENFHIIKTDFLDKIILHLATDPENKDDLLNILADITSGNYKIIAKEINLVKVEI